MLECFLICSKFSAAYEVVKANGVTDPQLSVKGIGFDRTLGGSEVEFRLREHLIKVLLGLPHVRGLMKNSTPWYKAKWWRQGSM